MTTQVQRINRRDQLFDYLADRPATCSQMRQDLKLSVGQLDRTVRDLRLWCGETDTINLVCNPQGAREKWLYELVGNIDAAKRWRENQVKYLETRLKTAHAVAKSLSSGADGRTHEGKKAKRIALVLGRLIEDLDELAPEDAAR